MKLFVIGHFSCRWHLQSRAYNFLHVIQADETLSSFTARQPIQILGKGVTSGVVVTGDGVYDTWEQFKWLVYIVWEYQALKRIKIVPVCEAFNSSRKFFSIQIFGVMPMGCCHCSLLILEKGVNSVLVLSKLSLFVSGNIF